MITEKARPEILSLIRQHYPQLAERNLQDAIADEGTIMHFKSGSLIMDFGAYVKIMPLIIKGSIKVSREDEEGNELFLFGTEESVRRFPVCVFFGCISFFPEFFH